MLFKAWMHYIIDMNQDIAKSNYIKNTTVN